MTKELYDELMDKRVITDTKMTFDYINENKLKLEDIITVPAILSMYLGKEEIVEEDIIVDENIVDENDTSTDESITDSEVIEETDVEETNNSDELTDEVETKEEILVEEISPVIEETIVKEKHKTKKK